MENSAFGCNWRSMLFSNLDIHMVGNPLVCASHLLLFTQYTLGSLSNWRSMLSSNLDTHMVGNNKLVFMRNLLFFTQQTYKAALYENIKIMVTDLTKTTTVTGSDIRVLKSCRICITTTLLIKPCAEHLKEKICTILFDIMNLCFTITSVCDY